MGDEKQPVGREIFKAREIANRIQAVINSHAKGPTSVHYFNPDQIRFLGLGIAKTDIEDLIRREKQQEGNEFQVKFRSRKLPSRIVDLKLSLEAPHIRNTDFSMLPADFTYPVVVFKEWDQDSPIDKTTPYGEYPDIVIGGLDRKIYRFMNYDFFSSQGESARLEEVTVETPEDTLEEELKIIGYNENRLVTVGFIASETSRLVRPIPEKGISNIRAIIAEIEKGDWDLLGDN